MTDWSEHEFESVVDKAKAIQSMVNIVEVAELLGLEPDHTGKIHSPHNEADETPSCQLYPPDHYFCYSTGKGGDAIDLVQAITGKSWGQAVAVLWNRGLRAGFEPGRHEAVRKPPPVDLTREWGRIQMGQGPNLEDRWAAKLGLEPELLFRLWDYGFVKFDESDMWIAHWHDDEGEGRVRGIKTRAYAGGKGSITGSQYSHGLYSVGIGDLAGLLHPKVAVITEGESDCWALSWHWRGQPVDVYALPCGAGVWREEWLQQLAPYERVYLAFDNDQAGERAAEKATRSIGWAKAERLRVPSLYNDVREAYVAGWRPNPPSIVN